MRNAIRFQKYTNLNNDVIARMIPDEFIKSVGAKPTGVFFSIVHNENLRNKFNICEAFIQESLYEEGKTAPLIYLYNENINYDEIYEHISKYIFKKTGDNEITYKVLNLIYDVSSINKTNTLLKIENGDKVLIDNEISKFNKSKEFINEN